MNETNLIDPKNLPMWTVAAFVLALVALVLGFAGIYRTNVVIVATQSQALALNKKIEDLSKRVPPAAAAPVAAPAAAAPAAPAAK